MRTRKALIIAVLFAAFILISAFWLKPCHAQIVLCNFRAWVYDSVSGDPVAGAVIELDWLPGDEFEPDYALTTDSNGFAERAVWSGTYNIRIRHSNYETYYEYGVYFLETGNFPVKEYFDKVFFLDPKSAPSTGHTLTFYLVDSQRRRVRRGSVIFQAVEYRTDWEGRVIIYNVEPGIYPTTFKGDIKIDEWNWKSFEFTLDVTMPNRDVTYTVWVESQTIFEGGTSPRA